MPRVSVLMATHNDASTISEAIESVIQQSYEDWELIVVDDASTDTTREVVGTFLSDPRIRLVVSERNTGSGSARNRGLRQARGEFMAVMDADDISSPTRLELQVQALDEHPEFAAVSGQMTEFGTWGGPKLVSWPTDPEGIAARQHARKTPIPHGAAMFRLAEVVRVGGYDERCRRAQDYALFLKLEDRKLGCLPDVVYHYRTTRPISFKYVLANNQYAALARNRRDDYLQGVKEDDLPTQPVRTLRVFLGAIKSWVVRNVREKFAG